MNKKLNDLIKYLNRAGLTKEAGIIHKISEDSGNQEVEFDPYYIKGEGEFRDRKRQPKKITISFDDGYGPWSKRISVETVELKEGLEIHTGRYIDPKSMMSSFFSDTYVTSIKEDTASFPKIVNKCGSECEGRVGKSGKIYLDYSDGGSRAYLVDLGCNWYYAPELKTSDGKAYVFYSSSLPKARSIILHKWANSTLIIKKSDLLQPYRSKVAGVNGCEIAEKWKEQHTEKSLDDYKDYVEKKMKPGEVDVRDTPVAPDKSESKEVMLLPPFEDGNPMSMMSKYNFELLRVMIPGYETAVFQDQIRNGKIRQSEIYELETYIELESIDAIKRMMAIVNLR